MNLFSILIFNCITINVLGIIFELKAKDIKKTAKAVFL